MHRMSALNSLNYIGLYSYCSTVCLVLVVFTLMFMHLLFLPYVTLLSTMLGTVCFSVVVPVYHVVSNSFLVEWPSYLVQINIIYLVDYCEAMSVNTGRSHLPISISCLFHRQAHRTVTGVLPPLDH